MKFNTQPIKKDSSDTQECLHVGEKQYLVSAIVSVYNCERFIEGCLEDIENQTIADRVEIVVVNSGSQQNEESIIKRVQEKYTNIVYLKTQERETIYAAWNRGIKAASGKYITNANSDDRHRIDAFEIMSRCLENNNEIDLVYPSYRITHNANDSFEHSIDYELYDPPAYDRYKLLFQSLPGPFPMWRKSLHNSYGYFDESLKVAGDHEFWLRISESCKFFHINEYLGLYYHNLQGGEFRDPILTKTEAVNLMNCYIDEQFLLQHHLDIYRIDKIRKRQSAISFSVADFFFSQNRPELAKRYVLKSLSYRSNYLNNYKLLLYCLLPKKLLSVLRSIKNVKFKLIP
jgi:glycosyltransferase involved in cell wall biosynthesis